VEEEFDVSLSVRAKHRGEDSPGESTPATLSSASPERGFSESKLRFEFWPIKTPTVQAPLSTEGEERVAGVASPGEYLPAFKNGSARDLHST
jgi:hypothetical protein